MKRFASIVALLFLMSLVAACGGAKPAAQQSGGSEPAAQPAGGSSATAASQPSEQPPKLSGKLMLYTSIQPDAIRELEPAMKAALPGVDFEIFQAGTEKLIAKIAAEAEAGKVQADVLMVADPAYYLTLKERGMLLPYKPEAPNVLGERDPDGYFTSVRIINVGLGYNTQIVSAEEAPKKFSDMTDPKWKGRIGMSDPTLSGSAFGTVAGLADKYGWEFFEKLRANDLEIVAGHGTLQSKLASGELHAAIILEINALAAKQKGDPVEIVYPEDGILMLPSPIGIVSSTQNPDAAKALVDWWYGPEAQGSLAKTNMHPVVPGNPSPEGALPITEIQKRAIPMNWLRISDNYEQIKEQFLEVMK